MTLQLATAPCSADHRAPLLKLQSKELMQADGKTPGHSHLYCADRRVERVVEMFHTWLSTQPYPYLLYYGAERLGLVAYKADHPCRPIAYLLTLADGVVVPTAEAALMPLIAQQTASTARSRSASPVRPGLAAHPDANLPAAPPASQQLSLVFCRVAERMLVPGGCPRVPSIKTSRQIEDLIKHCFCCRSSLQQCLAHVSCGAWSHRPL